MKMRYIKLDETSMELLQQMRVATCSEGLRKRCQSLLMSHKGATVKQLACYFNVVRKTIYAWFTLWESGGVEAILHKTGTGCKKKLKDVDARLLKQKSATLLASDSIEDHRRNLKPVLSWLIHTYQVKVSKKTLQRFLKTQRLDLA